MSTVAEGYAVVILKPDGEVPFSSKRFYGWNFRHARIDAEIQMMEEALGTDSIAGPKGRASRDRLRVVHFQRGPRKDAPVQVIDVFDNPMIGKTPLQIQALLAALWRQRDASRA